MENEPLIDEHVASIFESIDVSFFVQCLSDSQNITNKTALERLNELVKIGLTLYVPQIMEPAIPKKEIPQDEAERSTGNAAEYQSLYAPNTSIKVDKYDGSVFDAPLMLLTLKKEQAFKMFGRSGLNEPYPWPTNYPFPIKESPANHSTDAPSKSENELDDLANNKERGSVKAFLGAILWLCYGQEWLDRDPEDKAADLIKDFDSKGIPQPLQRKAMIKWLTEVTNRIKSRQ